jgi:hypothetical protein
MHPSPHPQPAPGPAGGPAPAYYVPLPQKLLADQRDRPLAIGVYALIARVYRATRAPVPLSAGDLVAYDPTISVDAAGRALRRLVQAGYLLTTAAPGRRTSYRPTWGTINAAPRPWELDQPRLGCPRHVYETRLPQELLDGYLGRLEPHAQHGAHVTRYTTEPLLTLADVGAYALTLAGYVATSERLSHYGLLHDGAALPLPARAVTLALISQRRLFAAESPIALTPAGWRRAAFALPPPTPEVDPGPPLFFVPPDLRATPCATPCGNPCSQPAHAQGRSNASQRLRGRFVTPTDRSQGGEGAKGLPHPGQRSGGGGEAPSISGAAPASSPPVSTTTAAPTTTPAEERLLQLGVRRDIARSLANRLISQVERVITQVRSRQGVRDQAAWVVSALRALPADELPAAPPPPKVSDLAILTHPSLTNTERTRWLARFRNTAPADRPAVLAQFHQEHPYDTVA